MPIVIRGEVPDLVAAYRKARLLTGTRKADGLTLSVHAPHLWEARVDALDGHNAAYSFDFRAGRVMIDWFSAPEIGKGWGRKKFLALARVWRNAGLKVAFASPADGPEYGYTGYYFWPRIGFVGLMSKEQEKAVRQKGFPVPSRRIQDLFAQDGGPATWRKYGSALWGLSYAL